MNREALHDLAVRLKYAAALARIYSVGTAKDGFLDAAVSGELLPQDLLWAHYDVGAGPFVVHAQDLVDMGACDPHVTLVWEAFPFGFTLTEENFQEVEGEMRTDWFAERVSPSWATTTDWRNVLPETLGRTVMEGRK